jgi:hypothetical protein
MFECGPRRKKVIFLSGRPDCEIAMFRSLTTNEYLNSGLIIKQFGFVCTRLAIKKWFEPGRLYRFRIIERGRSIEDCHSNNESESFCHIEFRNLLHRSGMPGLYVPVCLCVYLCVGDSH